MNYGIYEKKSCLAQKDEEFLHIQDLIDSKRKMLYDKQKKLKLITNQNHFLDYVKDDYAKYYDYISGQKKEQIIALELLNSYIDNLNVSGELSKHNIEDAKYEQSKILREIKSIKAGLHSIMNNTNSITSELKEKYIVK